MVPTVAPRAGILGRLRHETRTAHRLLELRLDLQNPSFTRADYKSLLLGFYSIHCGWQSCADRVLSPALAYIGERHSHLDRLLRDLEFLGLPANCHCMDFSDIYTVPAALGCMYVLEGSTLGSQILSRSFKDRFGIADHNGGAFFYGYGELTGSMWKRFGTDLESWFQKNETTGDAVVAGADWMFRKATEKLTGEKA